MRSMAESQPTSRREFAQVLTLLGCAGFAAGTVAGQEPKLPDAKAYAEAIETIVRFRFGKQLSEEQLKRVVASATRARTRGEALRKATIVNADDPACAFRADLP
jgi:hypothetical protein